MKTIHKYEAWDGKIFDTGEACIEYENNLEKEIKKYKLGRMFAYDLLDVASDNEVEIYKVDTQLEAELLKQYIVNRVKSTEDCHCLDDISTLVGQEIMVIWGICDDWADVWTLHRIITRMNNAYILPKED